jgi:flavodoxin
VAPDDIKIMPGLTPVLGRTMDDARANYEYLQSLMPDDVALLSLTHISGGLDLTKYPLDGPLPELPPSNAAKARQALVVKTARDHNMTLRQIARHTAAGTGHRVIVGTAEYMADEMEKWLKEEAADGFNVVCNHYPKPFEDFCTQVVPLLQQRGVFRTEYEGTTLRENLGLQIPENRYTQGGPSEGGIMKRRTLVAAAGIAAVSPTLAKGAFAQGPTEKVRKINLYTWPQAALPQAYQAAQLIAQQWRQLGLDVDVKPLQRQAQTQLIWFSRDKWDATSWRMVGRPERSDPDEFLYSLYHSSHAEKGYNFIGYINKEYDALAEKQRTQLDKEERRKTAFAMQQIIDRDQPQAFLVIRST